MRHQTAYYIFSPFNQEMWLRMLMDFPPESFHSRFLRALRSDNKQLFIIQQTKVFFKNNFH